MDVLKIKRVSPLSFWNTHVDLHGQGISPEISYDANEEPYFDHENTRYSSDGSLCTEPMPTMEELKQDVKAMFSRYWDRPKA